MVDYLLSEVFVPGNDLISKAVLTDDRIINIICKNLQDHYMAVPNESLNKSAFDVVYRPKMALSEYPPIIIEIQENVNDEYMPPVERYSTLAFEKYISKFLVSSGPSAAY
ncbi:hypothetical protein CU098_007732 [Rhizopus stolonifer]|uniref:Uncharacterized protein n=1 Tax=Rhizopus stolonifer TaxID=4846 RepID=A0A367JMB7_RHIST|nr:hypothetical protein CU098_007732 [Rhizopus stolonifer]